MFRKPLYLVVVLYALFASTFTLSKIALSYCSPILFTGIRMLIAGALLLGYQVIRRRTIAIQFSDLKLFLALTAFHIYIAYITEFIGLQSMGSAKAALIFNMSPFMTALVAYCMFHEKLTVKKWIGMLIAFAGFIPLLRDFAPLEQGIVMGSLSCAEFYLLVSVLSSAVGWNIMRLLTVERAYSFVTANGYAMLGGGVASLITAFACERPFAIDALTHSNFIQATLGVIVISSLICYNLYGYLLKQFSTTFLSFCGFMTPLFALLFGYYLLSETIEFDFFITVCAVVVGLFIFYREELR